MYPGRNFPPRRQYRRENVNESIRAREVRAVFPDGTSRGHAHLGGSAQGPGIGPGSGAGRAHGGSAGGQGRRFRPLPVRAEEEAARRQEEAARGAGERAEIPPQHRRPRLRLQEESRHPLPAGGQSGQGGSAVPRPRNRPRRSRQEAAHALRRRPDRLWQRGRPAPAGRPQRPHPDQPDQGHRCSQAGRKAAPPAQRPPQLSARSDLPGFQNSRAERRSTPNSAGGAGPWYVEVSSTSQAFRVCSSRRDKMREAHVQRFLRLYPKSVQHEPGSGLLLPQRPARGSSGQPDLRRAEPQGLHCAHRGGRHRQNHHAGVPARFPRHRSRSPSLPCSIPASPWSSSSRCSPTISICAATGFPKPKFC